MPYLPPAVIVYAEKAVGNHTSPVRQGNAETALFSQMLMLFTALLMGIFYLMMQTILSLWNPSDLSILKYGAPLAALVIIADLMVMKWAPKHMYDDEGINEKLFRERSYPHIVILTLFIAFAEEILFRGVIQTHFGLWAASIIFAILHFRYLKNGCCL